jgi:hypothetical protein
MHSCRHHVILAALDQNRVTKKCNQNGFEKRDLTGDGDELYAGYYDAYFTFYEAGPSPGAVFVRHFSGMTWFPESQRNRSCSERSSKFDAK